MSNWQEKSYLQSWDFNNTSNPWQEFSSLKPYEDGFYETREKYINEKTKTRCWYDLNQKWFEIDENGDFVESKINVFYWRLIEIDFMIDGD